MSYSDSNCNYIKETLQTTQHMSPCSPCVEIANQCICHLLAERSTTSVQPALDRNEVYSRSNCNCIKETPQTTEHMAPCSPCVVMANHCICHLLSERSTTSAQHELDRNEVYSRSN